MKNRVILLVIMMCGLLVGANTAYSQSEYCVAALGSCPPVVSRTITINLGTPQAPCIATIRFCIACCDGVGKIYFKEATWFPSGNCPDLRSIFSYLHRASDVVQQQILAAMILDASAQFALAGNGCQSNLQLTPPCPDQSNMKWMFYRSTCAHTIQRNDPLTALPMEVVEGCGSLDEWCHTLTYTCWDYSGLNPVLKVTTISQLVEQSGGTPGCLYQPEPGVIEIVPCLVVCP